MILQNLMISCLSFLLVTEKRQIQRQTQEQVDNYQLPSGWAVGCCLALSTTVSSFQNSRKATSASLWAQ